MFLLQSCLSQNLIVSTQVIHAIVNDSNAVILVISCYSANVLKMNIEILAPSISG